MYFKGSLNKLKYSKGAKQTCYKALKLKKSSLKKPPAVGFKFFMKEIAVHYKL